MVDRIDSSSVLSETIAFGARTSAASIMPLAHPWEGRVNGKRKWEGRDSPAEMSQKGDKSRNFCEKRKERGERREESDHHLLEEGEMRYWKGRVQDEQG